MNDESSLPKNYDPARIEIPTYRLWTEAGAFDADPDARPPERRYVIMMPLPNVTGALHMGHAMDNVMQDLLIRWHRMMGDNALWMPGTDHAGIATQAVIEKRLKELEGLTRHDLGREELVRRIWEWKDQYEARIIEQQQRMGCGCDWRRHRFTMDPVCARAVRQAFFCMFRDGLIARGNRMVNWDVYLQTSVSDDEVYHETVSGHFWHLVYPIIDPQPGEPESVSVATTRPETMLGDTAVAVHPDPRRALGAKLESLEQSLASAPKKERLGIEQQIEDLRQRQNELLPRLEQLTAMAREGRMVRLPLLDRPMPLICDEWAKPELGSGCVKITPAHDPNDYAVWKRHSDEIGIINVLLPDGTLNSEAGPYAGLTREQARDRVVEDLAALGLLGPVEDRQIEIAHSDRSKSPIEPYISEQWFVRMDDVPGGVTMGRGTPKEHTSAGLVQAAMDAVLDGRVRIHPERYAKTYLDWLSEKRDWPVSRQLWWGHRIPVWSKTATAGARLGETLVELDGADGVAVRAHLPDRDETVALDAMAELGLADDETVVYDICLLEADRAPEIERLGFEQDPDVLDTWFSSALWPFSTLGWPDPETAPVGDKQPPLASQGDAPNALDYFYPGSCLVTARDIITLWVARMVLAGLYNLGDIPFTDVFIHANIQDGKGERMSKSKGNGIDPVDIIDRYGTDAMRYVLCDMQTGSQDIRLPVTAICPGCGHANDLAETEHGRTEHGENLFTYVCGKSPGQKKLRPGGCGKEFDVLGTLPHLPSAKPYSDRFEDGRRFCTKLWNSARFALMNLEDVRPAERRRDELALEDRWILDRLNAAIQEVQQNLEGYNPSAAIGAARAFFWSELCDWYLEVIKPRVQDEGSEDGQVARQVLAYCLDQVLRLFHPFVPFITEHLWQLLNERVADRSLGALAQAEPSDLIATASWPSFDPTLEDRSLRRAFTDLQSITRSVREVRSSTNTSPRLPLTVTVSAPVERARAIAEHVHVVERLAGVETLTIDPNARREPGSAARMVGELRIFVHGVIDDEAERKRLREELERVEREIAICDKKLDNPKFVERAPDEVVQEQRDRKSQYQASRDAILQSLAELG